MAENYNEKAEYSKKLESQINAITQILNLNTAGLIDGEKEKKLRKLKEQAEVLKRKIDTGEFEIAVIGLEKSGKSTFANALIQKEILPSDNERCTYTASSIEYSSEGASAVVEVMTENEFYTGFNEKIKMIGIENPETYSLPDTNESKYNAAIAKVEERLKKIGGKINKNLNEDILNIIKNKSTLLALCRGPKKIEFHGDDLKSKEFRNLICSPEQSVAVKKIIIKTDEFKGMPNAVLYDVPGFDSPTTLHKTQTKEFMSKADAIVLVSRANEPSFKDSEMNLFDDYKEETDDDETILADKMFPFANKVDIVKADNGRTWDEQVERNLQVIKKDLRNYCNFTKTDRITIGSAYANLHSMSVPNGHTDGIQEIKDKLQHYYDTERFEILKRRVTGYQKRIREVFEELEKEHSGTISGNSFEDYGAILQDLTLKSESIAKDLTLYKDRLKEDYTTDAKISKEVESEIAAGITKENFKIEETEMSYAKAKAGGDTTGKGFDPERTESYLRDDKFTALYSLFVSGIIKLAETHHADSEKEIRQIFINNLVGDGRSNSEIEKSIDEYIKSQRDIQDNVGYYQSLIERFSRDLFEILIKQSFGLTGRWNKFDGERDIFYSLAMFDTRKADNIVVEKQPLFYSLLFHDNERFAKYGVIKEVIDDIKAVLDIIPTPKIVDMVAKLAFSDKTADVIKKLYSNITKSQNNKEQLLENKLKPQPAPQQAAAKKEAKVVKPLPDEISENSYNDYFSDKRNKGEEQIKTDVEKDIEILHEVIVNVVVRAIRIEKPFLALQFGNISKLTESLKTDEWKTFVRKNLPLLRASEFSSMEENEQRRIAHKSIMAEIKNILSQMDNTSTTNTEN